MHERLAMLGRWGRRAGLMAGFTGFTLLGAGGAPVPVPVMEGQTRQDTARAALLMRLDSITHAHLLEVRPVVERSWSAAAARGKLGAVDESAAADPADLQRGLAAGRKGAYIEATAWRALVLESFERVTEHGGASYRLTPDELRRLILATLRGAPWSAEILVEHPDSFRTEFVGSPRGRWYDVREIEVRFRGVYRPVGACTTVTIESDGRHRTRFAGLPWNPGPEDVEEVVMGDLLDALVRAIPPDRRC